MAVFTDLSDGDVARLLEAYGLPAADAVTGIAEGTENTNFKILAGGRRFILTLFEARVAVGDLPYFLGLMEHVADRGLPSAKPIRMPNGDRLTVAQGRPAALIEFLPGRPNMAPSPDDARKAGTILARFHQASEDFDRTRPNSMGRSSWRDMAAKAGPELNRFGDGLQGEIAETLSILQSHWPRELPKGTIHADLFPDNLLLDDGHPTGLIDFYFACTDFLAYDLAIAANAYTPEADSVDFTLGDSIIEGYQSVRPLTDEEKSAMPTLLCGAAMRFFLSRAVDNIFLPDVALYTPKDPAPWLRLMRHHRAHMEKKA